MCATSSPFLQDPCLRRKSRCPSRHVLRCRWTYFACVCLCRCCHLLAAASGSFFYFEVPPRCSSIPPEVQLLHVIILTAQARLLHVLPLPFVRQQRKMSSSAPATSFQSSLHASGLPFFALNLGVARGQPPLCRRGGDLSRMPPPPCCCCCFAALIAAGS